MKALSQLATMACVICWRVLGTDGVGEQVLGATVHGQGNVRGDRREVVLRRSELSIIFKVAQKPVVEHLESAITNPLSPACGHGVLRKYMETNDKL